MVFHPGHHINERENQKPVQRRRGSGGIQKQKWDNLWWCWKAWLTLIPEDAEHVLKIKVRIKRLEKPAYGEGLVADLTVRGMRARVFHYVTFSYFFEGIFLTSLPQKNQKVNQVQYKNFSFKVSQKSTFYTPIDADFEADFENIWLSRLIFNISWEISNFLSNFVRIRHSGPNFLIFDRCFSKKSRGTHDKVIHFWNQRQNLRRLLYLVCWIWETLNLIIFLNCFATRKMTSKIFKNS